MLKINSLLNPAPENDRYGFSSSVTPPTTPANSVQTFSAASTSHPTTPITSTPKRQKRAKDGNGFVPGPVRGPVNYPPFECNEQAICLSSSQQRELEDQHQLFKVEPRGRDEEGGLISRNVQHIPYSSEKKGFKDKTGRGGFDVFRYSFVVTIRDDKTGEEKERRFPVMWDYQVGLVRITPFFKACKYTKTIPNKALLANPGLKELSHSITGGSVEAQGYWVPYSCARALCLTFCYPIRWALTPIFGPSFIKECFPPNHSNFARWKIDSEVVRNCALEQQGWRNCVMSRDATPTCPHPPPPSGYEIPRSAPVHEHPAQQIPQFKQGSPFAAVSDASSDRNYVYSSPAAESPGLSPKSKHRFFLPVQSPVWTSINRSGHDSPMSTGLSSPPTSFSGSLLTKPGFSSNSPNVSWRAAEPVEPVAVPAVSPSTRTSARRSIAAATDMHVDYRRDQHEDTPSSASESDARETSYKQPPPKKRKTSKSTSASSRKNSSKKGKKTPTKEWTDEDMAAARWLLNMHDQPRKFAAMRGQGQKRKADDTER